jgi:hypothetical protein
MSDSKPLTIQEMEALCPAPKKYDLKKLKEKQLDIFKKIIKEKNPNMTDDEVLKDAKETALFSALEDAIYFVEKHFPQLSSDKEIASFLQKTSLTRDLHKLFLYDAFPFDDKCCYSGEFKVIQAELVRDWVSENCAKLEDQNCSIGVKTTGSSLQGDVKKVRLMMDIDKVINELLSAKLAPSDPKKRELQDRFVTIIRTLKI